MKKVAGRFVSLSLPRRMVCDTLYASRQVPQVMGERRMRLGPLLADRKATAAPRPSLLAMFIKAFAIVAARRPELRRVFVARPWHRLYEYDRNLVSITIERDYQGESALFLVRLESPEQMPLLEIDARLRKLKEQPIEKTSHFRNALRIASLPLLLRRLFWSLVMNWMPRLRGRSLGTMGFSVTASMGAVALTLITPWTTSVYYDFPDADGSLNVRVALDHRGLDGKAMARALAEVEQEMLGSIRAEVATLRRKAA